MDNNACPRIQEGEAGNNVLIKAYILQQFLASEQQNVDWHLLLSGMYWKVPRSCGTYNSTFTYLTVSEQCRLPNVITWTNADFMINVLDALEHGRLASNRSNYWENNTIISYGLFIMFAATIACQVSSVLSKAYYTIICFYLLKTPSILCHWFPTILFYSSNENHLVMIIHKN